MSLSQRAKINDDSDNETETSASTPDSTEDALTCMINWEVDKVSTMEIKKRAYSHVVDLQGIPWKCFVWKTTVDGANWLGVYISGMDNNSIMWSVEIDSQITVLNNDPNNNKERVWCSTYNHSCQTWGFDQFVAWNDLVDEEKGFVKDDKIKIEIRITITNVVGIRKIPTYNFTTSGDPRHDLTLVIGEKKLYVSRQFLAIHSPVLSAMFYGNFEEQTKDEIELKDVEYEDVLEMLQVMYPSVKKITDATVERLLAVADYLQIKMILDVAEDYLIASKTFSVAAKLKLSGQYRLVHLQGYCLKSLTKIAEVKKLKGAKEYDDFSEATKLSLLEKIMKLPE